LTNDISIIYLRHNHDKYNTKPIQSKYPLDSMIKKKAARMLRKQLPRGSAKLIQENLSKKGQLFSLDYINKVLDPEDTRYNQVIINEAISIKNSLKDLLDSTEDQIMQ